MASFPSRVAGALPPWRPLIAAGRLMMGGWIALAVGCATLPAADRAVDDASDDQGQQQVEEVPLDEFDRQHWSWSPLVRPEVPAATDDRWSQTALDRFVRRRQAERQIPPAGAAARQVMIRRLTFDLTGLPPTPDQVKAFVNDNRPDAYTRLVDRLLASPDYGRHQAQSWLDLARFAETDGFEHDKPRPQAWQYRDWVVDALNADLPYDRFIRLQVAGDVLPEAAADDAIATTFCLAGPDMPDINSQEERRDRLLNDLASTVGSALLGLQMGCAQCHDHKFDPISQADFYRLRACFETAVQVKKNRSVGHLQESGDDVVSRLMLRGDWRSPGPVVQPAFPRIANLSDAAAIDSLDDRSDPAQRRIALADWLTEPQQPLVPRVYANRIWQQHFGRGLSGTPSDFGYMGEEPWLIELLDYLACELRDGGWSRKRTSRQIIRSAVYRQSSVAASPGNVAASDAEVVAPAGDPDPANRYWSRFPRRRLTGEQLRDAMLSVSQLLSRQSGGPGVRPPLPTEMLATLLKNQWDASERPEMHHRRSIYIFARRNLPYPVFDAFDRPSALASCAVRHESTTAVQSLMMLNAEFSLTVADELVQQAQRSVGTSPPRCIEWLIWRLYSRAPEADERRLLEQFVQQSTPQIGRRAALADVALALLCSNEFRYLD